MTMRGLLYLDAEQVEHLCKQLDPVRLVEAALVEHAQARTVLPEEAYLAWSSKAGRARSLSMPAFVGGQPGVKIINRPLNSMRYHARASGVTILFDAESARPVCVMQGAGISAMRTAAITAISAQRLLRQDGTRAGFIGAGVQAAAHVEMTCSRVSGLREIVIYDVDPSKAMSLRDALRCKAEQASINLVVASTAEEAIRGSQLIVTLTTSTQPYIPHAWIEAGALIVHVSLDDLLADVFLKADKLFVDDWHLVAADERRILGKLIQSGLIASPSQTVPRGFCGRRVDAELGSIINGAHKGREHEQETIIVNPFGMAIEDLAIAKRVFELAERGGIGHSLPD